MIDEKRAEEVIWESTKSIFETMIFLPIEKTQQQLSTDQETSVTCSITFTGQLQGCFFVQCSMASAEVIAKSMLIDKSDTKLDDPEVLDALGEVTNLILGSVKQDLSEDVSDLDISIPHSIKGMQVRPIVGREAKRINVLVKAGDEILKIAIYYRSV